ncbi:putative uncharacterized GPI-anchored protein-lke [Helianthus annuus]|nr:putative uncharacterized GPI-anchored protein-lke [Helianthus annuus]
MMDLMLRFTLLLLLLHAGVSGSYSTVINSNLPRLNIKESQPVLPILAPSPLMPFTNVSVPKLSGKCPLNFSNVESVITTTAIDCWGSLAPYLANVVCCPQLDATINILLGQSSGTLTLNDDTLAKYCLSDITQLLEAQGSYNQLLELCSINHTNLTRASCPLVEDLTQIENILNKSKVFESCKRIDPVKECRHRECENAITDAAINMASKNYSVPEDMIDDCKKIVLRWLASKLEPSDASKVLRGISSCKINKVCPLVFPDTKNVSKACGNTNNNRTTCCDTLERYITKLQDQSFITNLQAISCASSFAASLKKANVSINVYDICRVKLKDFSLQDSGCLFPSLPFDVTYDQSSGIDFKCDLNDNVAAPWPLSPHSSSNPSTELPALPKATSDQNGLQDKLFISTLLLMLTLFI